ncbi:hypothetical protein HPB52_022570 [Rhipicephalus sanguineus]|uniref:Uncharacterized protein n=1 Tax=Rhipicephalus sanguineus TaxID=34632 RepID=A0A9D4PIZ0_RHISA|nr:hypothetical protein HPB52_022570 [Rhipicephalus sanguineus]
MLAFDCVVLVVGGIAVEVDACDGSIPMTAFTTNHEREVRASGNRRTFIYRTDAPAPHTQHVTEERNTPGGWRGAPGTLADAELKISLLKAVRFMYGACYEVKQSTISNCFKKAGFVRQDENSPPADSATNTAEAADLAELWAYVAGRDTGAVSMDEFLMADCAASSCEEVTDEAIAGDALSRQTTALSDDSSNSDNKAGSGTLAPTSMSTESALPSIGSLIDFMHSKGLPEVFAQQLESMHAAVVKLRLP